MNSPEPNIRRPLLSTDQIRGLLVHIDAEEVSLRNMVRLLTEIPLLALTEERERELRVRIEQSLGHIALLTENRNRVLSALGAWCGLKPEQVTMSQLITSAQPNAARVLVSARLRLQRLVRQVQTLTQSVAWVVNESRRVHMAIFESLPGTTSSDRYDATGRRQLNPASFRFGARS